MAPSYLGHLIKKYTDNITETPRLTKNTNKRRHPSEMQVNKGRIVIILYAISVSNDYTLHPHEIEHAVLEIFGIILYL